MSTKKDWDEARDSIRKEMRERYSEPPDGDLLEAYEAGRLMPAERERVEEWLAAYPEVAAALAAPFPADDPEHGDEAWLSPEQFDADWAAIRRRVPLPQPEPLPFRRVADIVAYAAAIGFAALFIWSQVELRRARGPRINTVTAAPIQLESEATRGGERTAYTLPAGADEYPLLLPLLNASSYSDYRLELLSLTGGPERTIWSGAGLRPLRNDALSVVVPRSFLAPGTYRLVVTGIGSSGSKPLARYVIRVPARGDGRE